ncbi:MAG: RpiB/LacA/LacB family sugar-phosphate isomerase, partial [Alphaproteobacteria bacterium]
MLLKMTKKFIKNTIYIASDHAGFTLKKYLIINLQKINLNIIDLGTDSKDISVDYPDFA